MGNRRAERECRGNPATADALADRAPDPQFVRHRGALLKLQVQPQRSLGRVAGPVRAERKPALIDRLDDVRSQVRQAHEDYSDSPNENVVKKCRSLVNASRSRIVGRRPIN